ncbi:MAG TPA: precorrin-6y C5,15-methyltransferase (decarboxylating) subunit CbiE, partial [Acidimicrobiales bacterium]|nr:precorrin-6y C5,15-methyltransferase (decarboxylating) subunit CbiE [Acidimicrobiales bacterium]
MADPTINTQANILSLVGMVGGEWFGRAARDALAAATVITGDARHVGALPDEFSGTRQVAPPSIPEWLDLIEGWLAQGESVCALTSGDPGFFGLGRLAAARFGTRVRIYPAVSSVSLAFAHARVSWDDAAVVSAHGRPIDHAVKVVVNQPKVAVLCSPENPPQDLAEALIADGCSPRRMFVASRIGEPDERLWEGDLPALAGSSFDGLSVAIALAPEALSDAPGIKWGLPEDTFEHRGGMITKAEVRAVALGKLGIPSTGVLWDVGAGSGSVAFECAKIAPGLRIFAVERRIDDAERLRHNVSATAVEVVTGEAPAAFSTLPDPDRVFIGGGGPDVLEEVLKRLRPGGRVVATFASFGRAALAAERLGNVVQVAVSRGVASGSDGSFRLEA